MIMSGSSSSTAVNPPTPSLSSLASSTPPSSEFIYVNGNMTNTTPPMTVSSLDNMQLSLASIGQSISLEEALMRVSILMRENAELKAVLQQNNLAMREQCQVLSSVKHQWAAEREEMKHKFEQTRSVILDLRRSVEDKEAKLIDLEGQLANRSDELIVTKEESPSLSAQMNSLRKRREEAEKQAELHSAQNKFLQKQTEKLNDKIAELIEAKSNVDSERVRLIEDNEKLTKECDELKKLTVKQQETQERLVKEKQDLLTLNSQLQDQVQQLTDQAAQLDTGDAFLERHAAAAAAVTADVTSRKEEEEEVAPPGERVENPKYDTKRLAGLETELAEEKRKITRLQTRLSEQNTLVQTLQRQIHEKDLLLAEARDETSKTVERLKKTHERQLEDLKSQLKLHPNYNEDVLALRAQVTSLVNELQSSEQRLKDTNEEIERYKHSCSELQARIILQEAEVSRQRHREDQLTADLREKIARIEASLRQEQEDKKTKEVSLQELRLNFDQLCTDYHELLSKHEDFKDNQGGEFSVVEKRKFQEAIDNLTAQIITAEEALANKDVEIEGLQEQLRHANEEVIPVLKAQAEVYMGDFKAEREAREKAHEQFEKLKVELEDLYEQNYRLEQRMNEQASTIMQGFRQRHTIPEEPEPGDGEDTTGNEAGAVDLGMTLSDPGHDPPSPPRAAQQPMKDEDLVCPMCDTKCPDYDSLHLHVSECLDNVQGPTLG